MNQFIEKMSGYGISPAEALNAWQDVINAAAPQAGNPIYGLSSNSSVRRDISRLAARQLIQEWGRYRVAPAIWQAASAALENEWE